MTDSRPADTIAVVGLGAMGSRIAARLRTAGYAVVVWNRSREKLAHLVEIGCKPVASPAAAGAAANTVIVMVSDPRALADVVEGELGIAAGIRSGAQLIVMSTVGPDAFARLSQTLPDGVDLLDAPVLGSVAEVERGDLDIFLGGTDEAVRHSESVLGILGRTVRVGPVGAGSAAKLIANMALFGVTGVLGEALKLGRSLGLGQETTFAVLARTPLASQAQRRRASIEAGEFPCRFRLSLARKDAELALAAAASVSADVRLARAALSWLADAEEYGLGEMDYTAVLATILDGRRSTPAT